MPEALCGTAGRVLKTRAEPKMRSQMKPEDLAYWYFRLNGFFTIPNFILHPSRRGPQRTDADIVGVRFPHRSEFTDSIGGDEPIFSACSKPYFLIAEVKRQQCALNGPWTGRGDNNIHAILRDLGPIPLADVVVAAAELHNRGVHTSAAIHCSLFCVGSCVNSDLLNQYPDVPQRTWRQVLEFIHRRFDSNEARKADHEQWDGTGQALWRCFEDQKDRDRFVRTILMSCGLKVT